MPAVTRKGDADVAHCSGMVRDQHSPNVYANGIFISRQGDVNTGHKVPPAPCPSHTAPITTGSPVVFINNKGCGRVGDAITGCTSVAEGSPNVFAGDTPWAGSAPSVVTVSGAGAAPAIGVSAEQSQAIETEITNSVENPPNVGETGDQVPRRYPPTPSTAGTDSLGTSSGLVQPSNANTSTYPGSTPPPTSVTPENSTQTNPRNADPDVAASTATADQIPAFLTQLLQEAANDQWDENGANPNIIGIWSDLGFPDNAYWKTDSTPWCAGFANWVLKKTGYKFMQSARAYDFRDKTSLYGGVPVPLSDGQPGDIVVWDYSHVNFIYSVPSPGTYTFCGGNQSDRATTNNNPSGGTITNSWRNGWTRSNGRISGIYRPVRA
jgi:uncharacterized protein (TIGR02594 family)